MMFTNRRITAVILLIFILSGCKAIEEFTNMKILKIESFSPTSKRVDYNSITSIQITFSEEMDKSRGEDSFSLKTGSSPVNGKFSWNGKTLNFFPFRGFTRNISYTIEVSTNAEDSYGNSLPEKFIFSFSTAAESDIPFFISSVPADRDIINDLLQDIRIVFSEPLLSDTVFSSFSIFPDIIGYLALEDKDRNIVFTPLENYSEGSDYTVTISEELTDVSGNNISNETEIFFTVNETEKENLIWLGSTSGMEFDDSETVFVNTLIEKDVEIKMIFDRQCSDKFKENPFKITPAADYTLMWNPLSTEAVITFENNLYFSEIYEITADEKTYRLLVNGLGSKPPALNKIVFCNDSSSPVFEELTLNKGIVFQTSDKAFFDFYFSLANAASLNDSDIFSCIKFKTVNGDLSVKPLRVINPHSGIPTPSPPPAEDEYIFRIECSVTAGTQVSPFSIEISSEFKDSLFNIVENEISMQITSL